MKHATIERLKSSEDFLKSLEQMHGVLSLQIETSQCAKLLPGQSVEAAVQEFNRLYPSLPYDLIFRAYNVDCECAWYGVEGVCVFVGEAGDYDVNSVTLKGEKSQVQTQEIVFQGRILYRKLTPGEEENHANCG